MEVALENPIARPDGPKRQAGGLDRPFAVVAGPCAIESESMFLQTAQAMAQAGATHLRGGIFKLRTQKSSFQGLGLDALELVGRVKKKVGLPFISEITDPRQIESLSGVVDIFQVGARNMYNYELLKELSCQPKPILLKRGFSATIKEWLAAADYLKQGSVVLCERGIRGFDAVCRNVLDIASAVWIEQNTGFQVWVDPSHGTGIASLVAPMAYAAAAAGVSGLMIEVHPSPRDALSDKEQALSLSQAGALIERVRALRQVRLREVFL